MGSYWSPQGKQNKFVGKTLFVYVVNVGKSPGTEEIIASDRYLVKILLISSEESITRNWGKVRKHRKRKTNG